MELFCSILFFAGFVSVCISAIGLSYVLFSSNPFVIVVLESYQKAEFKPWVYLAYVTYLSAFSISWWWTDLDAIWLVGYTTMAGVLLALFVWIRLERQVAEALC